MKSFREIDRLMEYVDQKGGGDPYRAMSRIVLKDNVEIIGLLRLLERVNPCGQEYHLFEGIILVSYIHHLNLLNFTKRFSLKAKVRIIGLPVSLCLSGILTTRETSAIEREAHKIKIRSFLKELGGLSLVLNSEIDLSLGCRTLSAFVFYNRFSDFQTYLDALRAPYRRRVVRALDKGKDLEFRHIPSSTFSVEHYDLYLSILDRTENPLETLPITFFKEYDADIFEVRDGKPGLKGFVQIKSIDTTLYFMFCGFRKDPARTGNLRTEMGGIKDKQEEAGDVELNHIDLYHNMLLFIIRYGIEKGYERIEMGQTSEETKLKLGCVEEDRYLYLHHGNPVVDAVLQKLAAQFSYKGYPTWHHVFKEDDKIHAVHVMREKETG